MIKVNKKEKLLSEIQKLQQKGQGEKCIPLLQEGLRLDPADMRLRQRLAEQLVKLRRNEEARKELEIIGKDLTSNGFYLKGIAVYKQIERLFPDDIDVILNLASLNEQHGLMANAMAEYRRAYDYFDRNGNHVEMLKMLEVMQRVDGKNPNIKLKYAEVLYQQGKIDEAFEAFRSLGLLLVEQGGDNAFGRLAGKVAQLFKGKGDFTASVLGQKIAEGGGEQVARLLQGLIRTDPRQEGSWQLLMSALRSLEDKERLKLVCQHYIRYFPDALLPREQLIAISIDLKDAATAIRLMEQSEELFIKNGAMATLVRLYQRLDGLIPFDLQILKGLAKACELAGDHQEASVCQEKIRTLSGFGTVPDLADSMEQPLAMPLGQLEASAAEQPSMEAPRPEVTVGTVELDDDDPYQIVIELDDDTAAVATTQNNWFETVNDIFDNIPTKIGKVRFAEGMDNGDAQSQFDLGLAFYEMGLLDEAINSFRQAAVDPTRRVECLIMQGACLRDKGELEMAENALRTLLAIPDLTSEDSCALKYELALTCQAVGKGDEGRLLLQEVEQMNPFFRDIHDRLHDASELQGVDQFDFSEDDLARFDFR